MVTCNICKDSLGYQLNYKHKLNELNKFQEGLQCPNCLATSRDRLVAWALSNLIEQKDCLAEVNSNFKTKIFELSGFRGYPTILSTKFDYINSEFTSWDLASRETPQITSDVENLSFKDETFDIIISSEVFEHVRLIRKAFSEVYRTLKDGGYLILTIPFSHYIKKSHVAIEPYDEKDWELFPVDSHAGDTKEYRIYGEDIFEELNLHGFSVEFFTVQIADLAISKQNLFICRKGKDPEILINNNVDVFKSARYPLPMKIKNVINSGNQKFLPLLYLDHFDQGREKMTKWRITMNNSKTLSELNSHIRYLENQK